MKKILLSVLAGCMLAITSTSAQEVNWGAKAGMNIGTVGGDNEGTSARVGYLVGLTGEYMLSDLSSTSFELVYSSQGCKSGDYGVDLSYINIPIMYNYYVSEKFAIKAGVQPGFLVSAKLRYDGDSADIKDGLKTFGLAIPVGFSYNLTESLVLDARYAIGCTNVSDYDSETMRSNAFELTLGVKF